MASTRWNVLPRMDLLWLGSLISPTTAGNIQTPNVQTPGDRLELLSQSLGGCNLVERISAIMTVCGIMFRAFEPHKTWLTSNEY